MKNQKLRIYVHIWGIASQHLTYFFLFAIFALGEEKMKKVFLSAAVLIMSIAVFSQQITQESLVINIEVPVRVYKGNTFVDNLTIDDFEILDEGIPKTLSKNLYTKFLLNPEQVPLLI